MKGLTIIVVACACAISVQGATILPTDSRVVSDQTTQTTLGTVTPVTPGAYSVRSRANTGENDRQVATFLQFDVSSLTVADVNNTGFNATFRIDYSTRLNTINALTVMVGRNQSGTWNSDGSNNPLHDWGFRDEDSTVMAADGKILIANVLSTAPANDITANVSDIVKGWVEGTNSNWGFVLYYTTNAFQGVGLDNPELLVTIPEPSSMALAFLGLMGIAGSRGRRKIGLRHNYPSQRPTSSSE